jgi:hypothetical protein
VRLRRLLGVRSRLPREALERERLVRGRVVRRVVVRRNGDAAGVHIVTRLVRGLCGDDRERAHGNGEQQHDDRSERPDPSALVLPSMRAGRHRLCARPGPPRKA